MGKTQFKDEYEDALTRYAERRRKIRLMVLGIGLAAVVAGGSASYVLMHRAETMSEDGIDEMSADDYIIVDDEETLDAGVAVGGDEAIQAADPDAPLIEEMDGADADQPADAFPADGIALEDETEAAEDAPEAPAPAAEPEEAPALIAEPEETAAEETQVAEPVVEETAAPEPVVEETAAPEPVVEETAAPESAVEETAAPEPAVEETAAPVVETEVSAPAQTEAVSEAAAPETEAVAPAEPEEATEAPAQETEEATPAETEAVTEAAPAETEAVEAEETEAEETETEEPAETEALETETETELEILGTGEPQEKTADEVNVETEGIDADPTWVRSASLELKDAEGGWVNAETEGEAVIEVSADQSLRFRLICSVVPFKLSTEERTLIYRVPETITALDESYGTIMNAEGEPMADFAVDPDGTIRITFTEETAELNELGARLTCLLEFRTTAEALK